MTEERRLGDRLGAQSEQEAREFEETAARLGLAADPVEPSPRLKADLFAKIAVTPQLPAEGQDEVPAAREEPAAASAPAAVFFGILTFARDATCSAVRSRCTTWSAAWTPASVRPATTSVGAVGVRENSVARPSSRTPCTVRRPGCRAQPLNLVPS